MVVLLGCLMQVAYIYYEASTVWSWQKRKKKKCLHLRETPWTINCAIVIFLWSLSELMCYTRTSHLVQMVRWIPLNAQAISAKINYYYYYLLA